MPAIHFFTEDVRFTLPHKTQIRTWITEVATSVGFTVADLNYIFCSDAYLLEMNREHLQHDYYTDIITFDNSEEEALIEGDIFISIDRVKDNAQSLGIPYSQELRRVIIHGLLHLLGQGDKTQEEAKQMREREDACLSLYDKKFAVPRGTI